jgi:hypothetical protein
MNPPRCTSHWSVISLVVLLPTLCITFFSGISRACLTANIDKLAVQWSTAVVQARLISLGDKIDLSADLVPTSRPSGRPTAAAYRVLSFQVTDTVDGGNQPGDIVKVVALIGGQAGDGICPALLPESIGKHFILLLRPFDQTRLDVADNTALTVPRGAMVIVSQLGEADMNSETLNDLKAFVAKVRAAAPASSDQTTAQVEAVAAAHDDTEADQAEKAITEIGPDAIPLLEMRLNTANDAGKTRLRHLIDDLSPPALSAEPE